MAIDSYGQMVHDLKKPGEDIQKSLTPDKCSIIHMAMGISGESGELLDAIKKYTMYEKPLDRENVVEELGDLEFFMEGLRQELGISRFEVMSHNMNKLAKRYPAGLFTNADAQARADKEDGVKITGETLVAVMPEIGKEYYISDDRFEEHKRYRVLEVYEDESTCLVTNGDHSLIVKLMDIYESANSVNYDPDDYSEPLD